MKTTGERFEMTFALRLTVEGGLITRHHMYDDSLAVLHAFDWAPPGNAKGACNALVAGR
ncbi:hypothetical protein AB0H34_12360 [Saccharopolyspora shandongensis]|uniref:hypothetical protein n=1 Tax=Saccharopolyspora shandongensis TaxID=418495 RepID=UPI0033D8DC5B